MMRMCRKKAFDFPKKIWENVRDPFMKVMNNIFSYSKTGCTFTSSNDFESSKFSDSQPNGFDIIITLAAVAAAFFATFQHFLVNFKFLVGIHIVSLAFTLGSHWNDKSVKKSEEKHKTQSVACLLASIGISIYCNTSIVDGVYVFIIDIIGDGMLSMLITFYFSFTIELRSEADKNHIMEFQVKLKSSECESLSSHSFGTEANAMNCLLCECGTVKEEQFFFRHTKKIFKLHIKTVYGPASQWNSKNEWKSMLL